jgi:tRNA(Ile)-lysidine synthase
MDILENRFLNALRALISEGERVLVAVSAGADSVAMLRLLGLVARPMRLALVVAHVNHAMRPDADEDERFVRDLAGTQGLPFHVRRADPPPRSEEQARVARHRLLREMAREAGCTRILLAHTVDDQAETVLMRLVRGAGRRGLSGMRPEGPGPLCRPLLGVRRAELRDWLARRGQAFREDASNLDQRHLRNKVRARLVPLLQEMNPAVVPALARTAAVLAAEDVWMDGVASAWVTTHARPRVMEAASGAAGDAGGVAVARADLAALDAPLARRVARLLLTAAGADPRGLPLAAVDRVLELAGGTGAACIDLPGGMKASRDGLDLVLRRAHQAAGAPAPVPIEARLSVPGRTDLPGRGLVLVARVVPVQDAGPALGGARRAMLDADHLGDTLTVRTRLAGDVFHPLGATGPRRLKRFLIDRKVPRSRRDALVLVVGRMGIVWVAGVEIGHPGRVTADTRRVAVLDLVPAGAEVDLPQTDV